MKKITLILITLLTVVSCSRENNEVLVENTDNSAQEMERFIPTETGECSVTTPLIAGQNYTAGTVKFELNSTNDLVVTYTTTAGWEITKTHLYVGDCNAIPTNNPGNPRVGQFPYKSNEPSGTTEVVWTIPDGQFPFCGCIAAHAEVDLYDSAGNFVQHETAWAEGLPLPGNSWAMYFEYCADDCDE